MDSAGQSPQQNIEEDFHAEFMNDTDIVDRRRQPLNKNTAEPFSIPFLGFSEASRVTLVYSQKSICRCIISYLFWPRGY